MTIDPEFGIPTSTIVDPEFGIPTNWMDITKVGSLYQEQVDISRSPQQRRHRAIGSQEWKPGPAPTLPETATVPVATALTATVGEVAHHLFDLPTGSKTPEEPT